MFIIFVHNLTKVWFKHVWPEIRVPPEADREEGSRLDIDRWTYLHSQIMTLEEFKNSIKNLMKISESYIEKMLLLRRERPVIFCIKICSILSFTAYIGNRISDLTLITSFIALLFTVPGIYIHLLPNKAKEYLKNKLTPLTKANLSFEEQTYPESQNALPTSELAATRSLFEHFKTGILSKFQEHSSSANQLISPKLPLVDPDVPIEDDDVKVEDNMAPIDSSSGLESDEEQHDGFVLL